MNKRFKYGRAFVINSDDSLPCITDSLNKKDYVKMIDVVDLLNALNDENEKLRFLIDINSVSERKKLERQVDEQQATIRKLQDLCGESDGENAKLRIENKRLQEENEQLRNIIKQKEKEEKLYAKEILRLNELNKQTSEFTDILGGY